MQLAVASDHAGFALKAKLVNWLGQNGHAVSDLGCTDTAPADYPDYAIKVGRAVLGGEAALGILVCGTGVGMSMAANKIDGVRAALCTHEIVAEMARAHNDANIICLGARVIATPLAERIVEVFIRTAFCGGRHQQRLSKMINIACCINGPWPPQSRAP